MTCLEREEMVVRHGGLQKEEIKEIVVVNYKSAEKIRCIRGGLLPERIKQ
jgi:hypothetical protein